MHPARRSSARRDGSPTETQKAVSLSGRDIHRSQSLQSPLYQPHTPVGKVASSPSRSSPCISVSEGPTLLALFRPALRQAPHETSARLRDASPANTNSTTTKAPWSHALRETVSSLHRVVADRSSGCHRRPAPEAASIADHPRRNHSRDAPR